MTKEENINRDMIEGYAQTAKQRSSYPVNSELSERIYRQLGYSDEDLTSVPAGANLGLGCGNPTAAASLVKGERVVVLGSAAGFDCFLAANRIGSKGKVIGVDITPEMIKIARDNFIKYKYKNVEFRLGDIDNLPVENNFADVVISNCVINLSKDKNRVFAEVFRVLKPSGRITICDIVLSRPVPDSWKKLIENYVGGKWAVMKDEYLNYIKRAGFQGVQIIKESAFPIECLLNDPTARALTVSLNIASDTLTNVVSNIISVTVVGSKQT